MIYLFIVAFFFAFYHLFLYGIILQIIAKFKKNKINYSENYQPKVTLVTAAYNEEKYIGGQLDSFLDLDYPKNKINLIVVSDDSEDNTNTIVEKYAQNHKNIKLVVQKPRKGKASALNLIEPDIDSDIVVSIDASSVLGKDSICKLVRYFINDSIGLVAGSLKYIKKNNKESGEGLYWKYETWIRMNESKVYSIIVASGCLFAIRREMYTQVHPSSPDDFERTLITLENKYKAIIEPEAVVYEYLTEKSSDEISRKIRIISREWFALFRHAKLLNPITNFKNTLFLFSHKIIRWLLPVWSAIIFISSIILGFHSVFFAILAVLQVLLYCGGLIEIKKESKGDSIKLFKIPGYFLVINISAFLAFVKFIKGEQMTNWNTIRKT